MIVHGLRARLRNNHETGLPPESLERGVIRFWRHVDNSRQGVPDTHQLTITIPCSKVPCRREQAFLPTVFGDEQVLMCDPRLDVWTAPEAVEWIDVVTSVDPSEQLYPIHPRAADWQPE